MNRERFLFKIIGKGKIKIISMSKIKKIIAIIKNFKENDIREIDKGSKPHSKGESFSLSINLFFEIKIDNVMINKGIIIIVMVLITILR